MTGMNELCLKMLKSILSLFMLQKEHPYLNLDFLLYEVALLLCFLLVDTLHG